MEGLGIRHPGAAGRSNKHSRSSDGHLNAETGKAVIKYMEASPPPALQRPSEAATDPLHQTALGGFLRTAGWTTPTTTTTTTTTPLVSPLSPDEFRAALRRVWGLPFRAVDYRYLDCGTAADRFDLLVVTPNPSSPDLGGAGRNAC